MKGKPHLDRAILLSDDEEITLERYLARFPPELGVDAPALVCPLCRTAVHLSRMHDRNRTPTLLHAEGEHASCPLVNLDFASPAFAIADRYDPRFEHERRDRFMARWVLYLAEIRRYVPAYTVSRFVATLEHANVLHIWSCRTLTEANVLYIFLALASFMAGTPGASHSPWLRFLFDASVLGVNDLHRTDRPPPRFFRLHYRPSHQVMFPNANQLLDWREVPMSDTFLNRENVVVPEADVKAFADLTAFRRFRLEDLDEGPVIPIPPRKKITPAP